MDFASLDAAAIIAAIMIAATPLLLAALGETIVERAGVLNLGVEGMMIIGAIGGFIIAVESSSVPLGLVAGAVSGALLSLIFALITQYFMANHVVSGLALTFLGLGLSALIGQPYAGVRPPDFGNFAIPALSEIPLIGRMFFQHDPVVYGSILLVLLVGLFLNRTHMGRMLRAVGENHHAAHALGINVPLTRTLAIAFGGACAGLGGAYISLVRVPQWTEGMTAGAGWIALAIVIFGSWRPWRVLAGAYLFGGVTILQLNLQAAGLSVQSQYLSMTPYIATIIVLAAISAGRFGNRLNAPAHLGVIFHKNG